MYLERYSDGFAIRATRVVNGNKNYERDWFEEVKKITKKPIHVFCMTHEEKQDFIIQHALTDSSVSYVYHVFHDTYQPGCKYGREQMLISACSYVFSSDLETFARAFDPMEWYARDIVPGESPRY